MITATQLLCHLVGDWVLQSDWQARHKTKSTPICLFHCLLYTLPFLFLTREPWALGAIMATHFLIDRFYLGRYVVWLHNFIAPFGKLVLDPKSEDYLKWRWIRPYPSWEFCRDTGFVSVVVDKEKVMEGDRTEMLRLKIKQAYERPLWMQWLVLIMVDQLMHLVCNGLILLFTNS